MPKLVDYSVRFDFLRQAAFEVVLREGPHALSRRSVAAALGTSVNTVRRLLDEQADLRVLAADEVAGRRRLHWPYGLRRLEPEQAALRLLCVAVPDRDSRVAEELVWSRLVLDAVEGPEDRDRDGLLLRQRYCTYQSGWFDDDTDGPDVLGRPPSPGLSHHLTEREAILAKVVEDALDLLERDPDDRAGDRAGDRAELRALLAGLTAEVCRAALTPADAVAVLARRVARGGPARVTE